MTPRAGLLLLLAPLATSAAEAASGGADESGAWRTTLRNITFRSEDPSGNPFAANLARARVEWQAGGERVHGHVAYDHEGLIGEILKQPAFAAGADAPEPTYFDGDALLRNDRRLWWRHRLYRAWVRADFADTQIVVGRQRVAWGSGRLWNPSDRFNPVAPTAFEQDEKVGVDAVRAQHRRGEHGGVEALWAPAAPARGVRRKLALRWFDTMAQSDYALALGRFADDTIIAGDLAANWREGTVRAQTVFANAAPDDDYAQATVGYDRTFAPALLPAGLYVAAEFFYNGAADVGARSGSDKLETRARRLFGVSLGYDLTPRWRVAGVGLYDFDGGGVFVAPTLTWSPLANTTLTFATQQAQGAADSEFGARPDQYFVMIEQVF